MKSNRTVRKIDNLGRIVLPKKFRKDLNINVKDDLEFFVDNTKIILKRCKPACILCNSTDELFTLNNRGVCRECRKEIAAILEK